MSGLGPELDTWTQGPLHSVQPQVSTSGWLSLQLKGMGVESGGPLGTTVCPTPPAGASRDLVSSGLDLAIPAEVVK